MRAARRWAALPLHVTNQPIDRPTHPEPNSQPQPQTDEDGSPRYPPSATIPRNSSISHLSQEQAKVKLIRDAIRAEDKRLRAKVRVIGVWALLGVTGMGWFKKKYFWLL